MVIIGSGVGSCQNRQNNASGGVQVMARRAIWSGGIAAAAWLAAAGPALANGENGIDKVVRTPLPYWQVGTIDQDLSRRCSMGTFNQRVLYLYAGHFRGINGASLVGAAKGSGLNLFDSQKKADPTYDYWFFRDRTSNCIVFKAKVKPTTAAAGGPQSIAAPPGIAPGKP